MGGEIADGGGFTAERAFGVGFDPDLVYRAIYGPVKSIQIVIPRKSASWLVTVGIVHIRNRSISPNPRINVLDGLLGLVRDSVVQKYKSISVSEIPGVGFQMD